MDMTKRKNWTRAAMAVLVVVIVLGALALQGGRPPSVGAKPRPKPLPQSSFGSKEKFKEWCLHDIGGTWVDSAHQSACIFEGGVVVCDTNGNHCLDYPDPDFDPSLPPLIRPTPANRGTGSTHSGALDGGGGTAVITQSAGGTTWQAVLTIPTPAVSGGGGPQGGATPVALITAATPVP